MAENDTENAVNVPAVTNKVQVYGQKTVNVRNVKTAKRLLSKTIRAFMRGEINDANAKTLTYMLISFVSIVKDGEFETRLNDIEKNMKGKK